MEFVPNGRIHAAISVVCIFNGDFSTSITLHSNSRCPDGREPGGNAKAVSLCMYMGARHRFQIQTGFPEICVISCYFIEKRQRSQCRSILQDTLCMCKPREMHGSHKSMAMNLTDLGTSIHESDSVINNICVVVIWPVRK